MKIVYLYDGTPYMVYKDEEGEYQYPNDEWTEVSPPEGIYSPFYFNGNKWIGSTREEWLESLSEVEIEERPDPSMIQMAETQMQIAESSFQLRDTQKKLASTMLDNAEKDKSIKNLEKQQAQVLLELAEMKGEK